MRQLSTTSLPEYHRCESAERPLGLAVDGDRQSSRRARNLSKRRSDDSRSTFLFNRSPRTPIPARDRVMLSTWEKWVKYGRFPYKIILQLGLVMVTTWQIVRFNAEDAAYVRAANRNWYYYFFPADYDFESRRYFLYTVDETIESVKRTTVNYGNIVTTSVDQLSHPSAASGTCPDGPDHCTDGKLEVLHYKNPPAVLFNDNPFIRDSDLDKTHSTFWINEGTLGPLDLKNHSQKEVINFVQSVVWMKLTYHLVASGPSDSGRACLIWKIQLLYDFTYRGQFTLKLSSDIVESCAETITFSKMLAYPVHQLNLAIIILSVWSLILSVRSAIASIRLLNLVKRKYRRRRRAESRRRESMLTDTFTSNLSEDEMSSVYTRLNDDEEEQRNYFPDFDVDQVVTEFSQRYSVSHANEDAPTPTMNNRPRSNRRRENMELSFQQLTCNDKLRFFNLWIVLTFVAAILNITTASIGLYNNQRYAPSHLPEKLFSALGCSLLWVNLISFLTHKPSYYTIVLTLTRAVPRVARFLLGVVPILLGYALFGMLYFGDHSERFCSFGYSLITLFAVLNGDVIRETFMDLISVYPMVCQVYLYSFVCLFIYVVLNVFIAIVEESFFSTRAKARSLELFAKQVLSNAEEENNKKPPRPPSARVSEQTGTEELGQSSGVAAPPITTSSSSSSLNTDTQLTTEEQSYEWGTDDQHEFEHRKLKWLRKVLQDLDDEAKEVKN